MQYIVCFFLQLYNIVDRISPSVLYDLHHQLERLKGCKGSHSCTEYHGKPYKKPDHSVNSTSKPVTKISITDKEPTTTQSPTKLQATSYTETIPKPTTLLEKTVDESDGQSNKETNKNGNKEMLTEKGKIEKKKARKTEKRRTCSNSNNQL